MDNVSKLETLVRFGFNYNPFKEINLKTSDTTRIHRVLDLAVKGDEMVSIVGKRGSGKSWTVKAGLKKLKAKQVLVRSSDKLRLLISDIERAMILDLSEETPKRGGEIRARQLRRILGEASQKEKIVLTIEEAHRIHGMTLRALKTLREMDWMGESELFSVVLIGQSDPMNKAGVSEVRLRSDTVHLRGLSADEIRNFARKTVGSVFSHKAIEAVSLLPEAENYLELQAVLLRLMGRALAEGRKEVKETDVLKKFGSEQKRSPQKRGDLGIVSLKNAKDKTEGKVGQALQSILGEKQ